MARWLLLEPTYQSLHPVSFAGSYSLGVCCCGTCWDNLGCTGAVLLCWLPQYRHILRCQHTTLGGCTALSVLLHHCASTKDRQWRFCSAIIKAFDPGHAASFCISATYVNSLAQGTLLIRCCAFWPLGCLVLFASWLLFVAAGGYTSGEVTHGCRHICCNCLCSFQM